MTIWHRHFGVYGLCLDETQSRLLVIQKTIGPYAGRYDLPGGGLDQKERLLEAITREFLEETGLGIEVVGNLGTYDFLVEYPWKETTHTHHIAVFYEIRISDHLSSTVNPWLTKKGGIEANDSAGFQWVPLHDFTEQNASPLVQKALTLLGARL
jgi:8-oxo-dGTP pyrophosphatase MutT (NUDIX family)